MAKESNSVQRVEALAAPAALEHGFELVDVEFVKEGPNWYLRLYLDKEGGITIDDCELFSRDFEKILDEKDPIVQTYILEISSPGIDRPLKKSEDFQKYKGELIDIKLYKPMEGTKDFQGVLNGLDENDMVSISNEGTIEMKFNRKDIASVRLAVVF